MSKDRQVSAVADRIERLLDGASFTLVEAEAACNKALEGRRVVEADDADMAALAKREKYNAYMRNYQRKRRIALRERKEAEKAKAAALAAARQAEQDDAIRA